MAGMRRWWSVRWTARALVALAGLIILWIIHLMMINQHVIWHRTTCDKCVQCNIQKVGIRERREMEHTSTSLRTQSFSQSTRSLNTSYEKTRKAVNSRVDNKTISILHHSGLGNETASTLQYSGVDKETVSTQQYLVTLRDQYRRSSLLAQPIINDHNFTYIHTPTWKCRPEHPDTLIVVPSAPANFQRRHRVRQENYGHQSQKNDIRILFFIGVPSTIQNMTAIQAQIEEEVKNYGDIVQENFTDVYRYIRLKAVSMLRWASTRCNQVKFVIRLDDDILGMDPNKMVVTLKEKQKIVSDFIVGGRVRFQDVPDRNMKNVKWCLSKEEYLSPSFPPYALAGSLGYPLSTVQLLYEATLRVPPVWLDDVYITGICATQLNIPLFQDRAFSFTHKDTPPNNMT